jgi:sugar-specific transcriptional regulator TrmB
LSGTKNIESAFKIKYEMKYLFFGFIIAIAVAIVFIHIILFIIDGDRYMGTTSAVLLGSSTCISLFIILSNPRKIEVQKFKLIFVGVTLWFLGEFSYTYYQIVLDTDAPYPGVGEIFYVAGYGPLILFTYRSFKTINRDGLIKRRVIAFVVILASVVPVISTIQIFSQEVDFQSQWPDIALSIIYNYGDIVLLSLSILILTKLPRNNPYIYHWILFTSFLILTTITDLIYTYIAIVDEELLLKTELIWEAMWAFANLCILASLFWYYKLIHILSENSENSMTEDYAAKYRNNISVKDKGELPEEDQLHTEYIQDFKLVENRIDEIIKGAKDEITILFCNINTLKRKETQSILKFLKKKTRSNILVRILFPLGVDDRIINSYSEVANVRIFERKLENNDIIIVPDYIKVLLVSTTDPTDYDKETAYTVTYSDNEEITYTYVTTFEKLWLLQTVTKLEVR